MRRTHKYADGGKIVKSETDADNPRNMTREQKMEWVKKQPPPRFMCPTKKDKTGKMVANCGKRGKGNV